MSCANCGMIAHYRCNCGLRLCGGPMYGCGSTHRQSCPYEKKRKEDKAKNNPSNIWIGEPNTESTFGEQMNANTKIKDELISQLTQL